MEYLQNTVFLFVFVNFFALLWATLPAFLLSRYQITGSRFWTLLLMLPLTFPSYIAAFAYRGLFDTTGFLYQYTRKHLTFFSNFLTSDVQNIWSLALILSWTLYPYLFVSLYYSFILQARQYEETAKNLQLSRLRYYSKIFIPMNFPAFFAGFLLISLEVLNEYGATQYFGVPTFTTEIFTAWLGKNDWRLALKLASYLLIFVFFLLFLEKKMQKIPWHRGNKAKPRTLKKINSILEIGIIFICLLPFLLGFLFPLLQLVFWFIEKTPNLIAKEHTIKSLFNSIWISVLGTAIILAGAVFFSWKKRFKNYKFYNKITDILQWGYSIPGSILAMVLFLVFLQIDHIFHNKFLTSGFFLLFLAYFFRFFAVAWQPLHASCQNIPNSFYEMGQNLHLTAQKIFTKIHFPLLKPVILNAAWLVWLDVFKELPISFSLHPAGFQTLPIQIFNNVQDEELAKAAFPALCMIGVSLTVFLIQKKIQNEPFLNH